MLGNNFNKGLIITQAIHNMKNQIPTISKLLLF